jgi:hypothetical protein
MMQRRITLPLIGLIAGTRAALGAGIALLLADRLTTEQRRAVGWTLTAVGAISTIPLAAHVLLAGKEPASLQSERQTAPAM